MGKSYILLKLLVFLVFMNARLNSDKVWQNRSSDAATPALIPMALLLKDSKANCLVLLLSISYTLCNQQQSKWLAVPAVWLILPCHQKHTGNHPEKQWLCWGIQCGRSGSSSACSSSDSRPRQKSFKCLIVNKNPYNALVKLDVEID